MPSLYNQSAHNIRLTWIYITLFFVVVIAVGYVFAGAFQNSLILYIAVGFSIFTSVLSYWFSDSIVLKMNNAKELSLADGKEIYRMVENLSIASGMPMPKVYLAEDSALNAFATGRNPEHGVICLTTGIVNRLEKIELEGVIAHELSHIKNRDTLISTVVVVLVGFIALLADWFRTSLMFGGHRDSDNKNPIFFILAIVLSILAPLAALLIQLAVSRRREFLADASGATLTRYPEGLANALEKISSDPTPLRAANRATAHLYIANPFKSAKVAKLFMTHPPMEERVAVLRAADRG
jgi:heat shock protein HtpX